MYFLTIKYFSDDVLIIPFDFSNDNIKAFFFFFYLVFYNYFSHPK